MATGVGLAQISLAQLKSADPDNPLLGAVTGGVSPTQTELLPILCSNNGGWLPLQQGSVGRKFKGHHSIGRPRKPAAWCKERACIFKGA